MDIITFEDFIPLGDYKLFMISFEEFKKIEIRVGKF